jgi:hypothetical protein
MLLKSMLLPLVVSSIVTGAAANESLRALSTNGFDFFFFGDWGHLVPAAESQSGVNFEESKVAKQVNAFAASIKPAFFIALGDNFYELGVNSTVDPLWKKYYTDLFTNKATFVPWYPIFGNHDYYGFNPQPQIDFYHEQRDSRWTFPDYQYTRVWEIPGSKRTIEIIFINTVTLCPEAQSINIGFPENPTDAFPNPNASAAILNSYIWTPTLQWISNALSASKADIVLVAGHYHAHTATLGDTGSPEESCIRTRLVPLMEKYHVAVYMNGHKHQFAHHLFNGIHYLTVGHGSDKDDPVTTTQTGLLFAKDVGGFANFQVTDDNLNLKFIDENGKTIYKYTIPYKPR